MDTLVELLESLAVRKCHLPFKQAPLRTRSFLFCYRTYNHYIDFNALIAADNQAWKGMIGKHEDPAFNENGWFLLQLCCSNRLCLMNTFFQHRMFTSACGTDQVSFLIDVCIVLSDLFSKVFDV